jgi:hypothetical protein
MILAANSHAHVESLSVALQGRGSDVVRIIIISWPATVPLRWGWSRASKPPGPLV